MKITIEVPDAAIRQALKAASTRYWSLGLHHLADGSYSIQEVQDDGTVQHRFGRSRIAIAMGKLAAKHHGVFERVVHGSGDANDGDMLIQYACFGELKYG